MEAKIAYQRKEVRPIAASAVRRLYDGAGWWPDWDLAGIERAIAASVAVGAWDGERLVGFARAISDGEHRAYVEDVVIDPEYRGQGIGEQVVGALVEAIGDVHIMSLFCEPERVEFYGRNGFRASETAVMVHREQSKP
ncbi:MAG TPA: GNAT family N-acetyltransferase [Dehalococcoidia bacterium]